MPELADMHLFVRAVANGSLSAAGRELGFSPAVGSKRLSRLEAELGVRLLQRSSRRLALTEEGAIYFEHCQSILAEVAEVADAEAAIGRADWKRGVCCACRRRWRWDDAGSVPRWPIWSSRHRSLLSSYRYRTSWST